MKKLLSLITIICFATVLLSAQTGSTIVSGTITDASSGEPIIGASVLVKDLTGVGAVSDLDGKYFLQFNSSAKVLVYSSIGYKSHEVTITTGTTNVVNVQLNPDSELLEETVVIGYGSAVKKKDLSGAIGTTTGEALVKLNSTTVSQSLQGAIPGLQVTRSSGLPGASATIKVRGITTIGNSEPLVIVDGIPIGTLDDIAASDIESITVLKDAASASIYGSRAAAGVILVTTKRAETGKLGITYNGSFSMITPTAFPETVPLHRFFEMQNEIAWNDGGNVPGQEYSIFSKDMVDNYRAYHNASPDAYPLTDWKKVLIKPWAPAHKHNLSISYGNDIIKSNASISYENTDALYKNRNYNQFNIAINNEINVLKNLKVYANLNFRKSLTHNTQKTLSQVLISMVQIRQLIGKMVVLVKATMVTMLHLYLKRVVIKTIQDMVFVQKSVSILNLSKTL